jgi:integrase
MARPPKPWFRKSRGEWYVTIKGVRHRLGPDAEEAERKFHSLMAAPPEEPISPEAAVAVVDDFLTYLDRKPKRTKQWYQRHCQSFVDWLKANKLFGITVGKLKPYHVREWLDSHAWADATKNGAARAVQRAFRWALKEGLIPTNPVAYVDKPAPGRRENIISEEQYRIMLGRDATFTDLISVAWETGARPNELMRMEARHMDFPNHRVLFPARESKGKKRIRIVYLTQNAELICRRLAIRHPTGPIFRNQAGKGWNTFALNNRFQRLKKHLHRKFALVDFRYTFSDRLLKAGVDPITLATLLGHMNVSMLAKQYQHVAQNPTYLLGQLRSA